MPEKIGQSETFTAHGRTFQVKRLSRDTWHLRDTGIAERSRFGTRREIADDVVHVKEHGCLPRPCGPRW